MNREDEYEAQRFLDDVLSNPMEGYTAYFCMTHGRVQIRQDDTKPLCPKCGRPFTGTIDRLVKRKERLRRLGIMRNYLEG